MGLSINDVLIKIKGQGFCDDKNEVLLLLTYYSSFSCIYNRSVCESLSD
jgi:hypothetical protein